ncbi:hypothetical protein AAVH_25211 [Aphelenchoides avenae]|nr:hypothetical protein AAVH_25211 [Aphelenchus avenae]
MTSFYVFLNASFIAPRKLRKQSLTYSAEWLQSSCRGPIGMTLAPLLTLLFLTPSFATSDADTVADAILKVAPRTVPYPDPANGRHQYKDIATKLKDRLTAAHNESGYEYETVVYWPATGVSEHCVLSLTDDMMQNASHDVNKKNFNYVVTWHRQDDPRIQVLNETIFWDDELDGNQTSVWDNRTTSVLNKTFERIINSNIQERYRKSKKFNLCDRVELGLNNRMVHQLISEDTFHTLVAVKCARTFVWYQLAYEYFQAAHTTSDYSIEFGHGNTLPIMSINKSVLACPFFPLSHHPSILWLIKRSIVGTKNATSVDLRLWFRPFITTLVPKAKADERLIRV